MKLEVPCVPTTYKLLVIIYLNLAKTLKETNLFKPLQPELLQGFKFIYLFLFEM